MQIIRLADFHSSDYVLEIGPGIGSLTHRIIPLVKQIDIVEIDKGLVKLLQVFFSQEQNCIIHHYDILKLNVKKIINHSTKIISNLPYNIASQVFFKLMDIYDKIECLIVMLPDVMAEKLIPNIGTKKYGVFTIFFHTFFTLTEKPISVSSNLFFPQPKVSSQIFKIQKKKQPLVSYKESSQYIQFLSFIFQHRRKKFYTTISKILKKEKVDFLFLKYRLEENIRPEKIDIPIYTIFYKEVKIIKKNFDKL